MNCNWLDFSLLFWFRVNWFRAGIASCYPRARPSIILSFYTFKREPNLNTGMSFNEATLKMMLRFVSIRLCSSQSMGLFASNMSIFFVAKQKKLKKKERKMKNNNNNKKTMKKITLVWQSHNWLTTCVFWCFPSNVFTSRTQILKWSPCFSSNHMFMASCGPVLPP